MESLDLDKYSTFIFDCDGVLLNSNQIKTKAFFDTALPYGSENAQRLVEHHVLHGGVSRYRKFSWFVNDLLEEGSPALIEQLVSTYALKVIKELERCDSAPLNEIRARFASTNWMVASGGDQSELRKVFDVRSLTPLFDLGIFGSPDDKSVIIEREIVANNLHSEAVLFGDSKYDFEVARQFEIDFVYVSSWSEWHPTGKEEKDFTGRISSLDCLLDN